MTKKYDPFVHLHLHGTHSLLDGYSTIDEILDRVEELGQDAVALTDHGNLHGAYEFYKKATARGIKPIIGYEAYVAPSIGTHTDHHALFFGDGGPDDVSSRGSYTHMLLIAKNNTGFKNLMKLNYLSYTEGFWKKNRISIDLLREYHEGLIGTTGCPSGELQTRLRLGQKREALEYARMMQEIFGAENYFMEVMDHNMSHDLESRVLPDLLAISQELNIPLIAVNDAHYAYKEDADVHEHMLAISTHSTMSVPTSREEGEGGKTRFAFDGDGYYIKSYEEMAEILPESKYPNALSNTRLVADMCDVSITPKEGLRPEIEIPEGFTAEEWLRKEALDGLARRLPDKVDNLEYLARLDEELDVIIPKNYTQYFLVVSDLLRWAKYEAQPPIPAGAGRGSAAGSLLAFVLDITDVDPIPYGLLFSRFLNVERDSPPDIDIDLNDTDRDRAIQYVTDKYGADKVSYVATFGRIGAKQAIRDVSRILSTPYNVPDILSKAIPKALFGKEMTLKQLMTPGAPRYDEAEEFRAKVKELGAERVIDLALRLEGRVRSTGVHAAAIVISNKPIIETVPQSMRQADRATIIQWEYLDVESLGLLKMDFLGLRNLGIIAEAVRVVKMMKNIDIDPRELQLGAMDDPKTYKLLQEGNTSGIFQIEGSSMQALLRLMKPTEFEDIAAVLALHRPGPMAYESSYALRKNGKQQVDYIHPELEHVLKPILGPTYGYCVFQEQIQLIARDVAGYSLAAADNLRRAMGKKKKEILDVEFVPFREGARARGYSDEAIKALWDVIVPFADYAFNKSHAVAYAMTTYVTAYLKANYPAIYIAALLSSVADNAEKTALYLEDAKQNNITVLQPDVNRSKVGYATLDDSTILVGLNSIRGIGADIASIIVKEREENGKYKDLSDFITRLPSTAINKRVFEALAYAGGFESFGINRQTMIVSIPYIFDEYRKTQKLLKQKATQGDDLFSLLDNEEQERLRPKYTLMSTEEYLPLEKLKHEREYLGLYVSAHPLDNLNLRGQYSATISQIHSGSVPIAIGYPKGNDRPRYSIAGLIGSYQQRFAKATGKPFASGTVEDKTGTIEFVMFSETVAKFGDLMKVDGVYSLTGYAQKREENISFVVDSVRPLDFNRRGVLPLRFKVTVDQWEKGKDQALKLLEEYRDDDGTDVIVSVRTHTGGITEEMLPLKVSSNPALASQIRALFGATAIGRWRAATASVVSEPVAEEVVDSETATKSENPTLFSSN